MWSLWGWLLLVFAVLLIFFGAGLILVKVRFKKHYKHYYQK